MNIQNTGEQNILIVDSKWSLSLLFKLIISPLSPYQEYFTSQYTLLEA